MFNAEAEMGPRPLSRSAQFYRGEAARLRREAKAITHPPIRLQMLSAASDYEALAKTVETISRQLGRRIG
jgi:hypothetical protein